jgi:mannose/fructose-specific phosphotransferase system component IIA
MKKLLIATHGKLADGYRSSLSILTGMQDSVEYIDAYVDESDYTPKLQAFIDSVGPDDTGVIFTDIYGGSVFQKVALMLEGRQNIFHVTGINLGLVIELLLTDEAITPTYLEEVISAAREGMRLVALEDAGPQPEGEDEFFE